MKVKILSLLIFITLCLLPFPVNATIYNYYFADDGGGTTCSEGSPCSSLSIAQDKIDAADSTDTVNLYFARGDTWAFNTGKSNIITVDNSDPIVNFNAYGSGDRPIFDGNVSDFSAASPHGVDGYYVWTVVFQFMRNSCSIKNFEIKNIYGSVILLGNSDGQPTYKGDYFTLSGCKIHDIGYDGIFVGESTGTNNATIEYNEIYAAQELYRNNKVAWWGSGIKLFSDSGSAPSSKNNIRYNVIYNIYGEGITSTGGTIEYNIVGDTGSVGIYPIPGACDAQNSIVRYNLVIMSGSGVYHSFSGAEYEGIVYFDENSSGGSNGSATIEIYGNIVINRYNGIWVFNGDGLGEIRIYNNTVIDSNNANLVVGDPGEFNAGYIYNNASILYDNTSSDHVGYAGSLPHANWTVENNAYFTSGGGLVCSNDLDNGWIRNCTDGDPKLLGELLIDWDGLSGAEYYKKIDFNAHLYLPADSSLVNAGKTLSGYEETFLTYGSGFGGLPDTITFKTREQTHDGTWDIGAIVYESGSIPKPPTGLNIK